jgi:predicted nucleotidyltransferase
MITPLSGDKLEAAREIAAVFGGESVAIVGAAALGCWIPLRKRTEDVDFVIATGVDFGGRMPRGWRRHPKREHEWTAPNEVVVDIIPATREALETRVLVWPESGHRMNLTGMRLVFDERHRVAIAPDLELLVPAVPVIAVLKMIAYVDRFDRVGGKDLAHLALILDEYPPDDDERMFTHEQAEAGLTPEIARAQVLGREVAVLVDAYERAGCARFIDLMRKDTTHAARMTRHMIQPMEDRDDLLERRLDVLGGALGLER